MAGDGDGRPLPTEASFPSSTSSERDGMGGGLLMDILKRIKTIFISVQNILQSIYSIQPIICLIPTW